MAAEIAEPGGAGGADASFGARLFAAGVAVDELSAAVGGLGEVADEDLAGVMGELTTLVGRLDGLRVAVTAQVRDREAFRRAGAASVTGWLRADVRTADIASSLAHLSARVGELPGVTGLLADGQVSLAQAGAACWQIARLPETMPDPQPAEQQPVAQPADEQAPRPDDGGPGEEEPEELWAGLWRRGNVHAAADELFARFMPRLDGAGLRVLGAHLREAADAQERAGEDYDAHARRRLRVSRGFGGVGEVSGRLDPEAAEQVLATFAELGGKAGPDDPRTKAQRWADVLVYLTGMALPHPSPQPTPTAAPAPGTEPTPSTEPTPGAASTPVAEPTQGPAPASTPERAFSPDTVGVEADDDRSCLDGGHGHDIPSWSDRPQTASEVRGRAPGPGAGVVPAGLRRPRVIVTVPLSTLLGQPLTPGAVLAAGTPITGEAARKLACDADLIRLITAPPCPTCGQPPGAGSGGGWAGWDATGALTEVLAGAIAQLPRPLGAPSAVLDIGRSSPSWTPRQRDALHASYGGRCAAPGCSQPIEVIHHIVHWAHGGPTSLANGAPFCNFHHWLVHEGGWQVAKDPTGTVTLTPPPPGWQPGTIYRRGKPLPETTPSAGAP